MKKKIFLRIFLFFLLNFFGMSVLAKEDCSCPKVRCGPCQKAVQIGKNVKFCSWGDINVCKKIICENVSGYFQCLSKGSQKKERTPASTPLPLKNLVLDYEQKVAPKKIRKRKKTSQIRYLDDEEKDRPIDFQPEGLIPIEDISRNFQGEILNQKKMGKVRKLQRGLEIQHGRAIFPLEKGRKLFVGDSLSNPTGKPLSFNVQFSSGEVRFLLAPKSQLKLQDPESLLGRFHPFIHLLYGEVRTRTEMKNGALDVLAGGLLARVQTGKSHIQYQKQGDGLKVNIANHGGDLRVFRSGDLSGSGVGVSEGSGLSWFSQRPLPASSEDSEAETLARLDISGGVLTPVFQLPAKTRQSLGLVPKPPMSKFQKWPEKGSLKRQVASAHGSGESSLCAEPQGDFNVCAWKCEGSAKGAKSCRAHKKGIQCVRRVYNAAGQWGQPTAFEQTYSDLCPAQGVRVGPCQP